MTPSDVVRAPSAIVSGGAMLTRVPARNERTPNTPQSRFQRTQLPPAGSWKTTLPDFGLAGTQVATLEVSALPPINLDGRLDYLVHYPHGCLEHVKRARDVQVPKVVDVLGPRGLVDPVPGGDMDDAVPTGDGLADGGAVEDGTLEIRFHARVGRHQIDHSGFIAPGDEPK